ncbi:cytochrome c oxidase assembly protein [Rhodococcus aerolatus]
MPLLLVAGLGAWYTHRVRKLRRGGGAWPKTRIWWYAAGLTSWLLVTVGVIGVYAPVLFSARAVQVVTLLMITPQLLAHAMPFSLARDTATVGGRAWCSSVLHSAPLRAITHPLVGVLVLLGMPIVLYGTDWFEAGLRNHATGELTQLALFLAGAHYFWTRLQRDPVPRLYPQYVTVALTFAEVGADIAVPLAVLNSRSLIAGDYYLGLDGLEWVDRTTDQAVGGGVLWVLGDLALIPFLILSVRQARRRDGEDAARIDAELDAAQRTATTASAGRRDHAARAGEDDAPPATMRPWWEDDPEVTTHFRWSSQQQDEHRP